MTFGFPAYHEQDFQIPPGLPPAVIWAAIQTLGWSGNGAADGSIFRVSTSVSLASWGEAITITRVGPDRLRFRSECSMPTQCFDWGRNEGNYQKFCATLIAVAQGQAPPRF